MRRFSFAMAVVFTLSLFAVPVQAATQYHTGADLVCHDCHTIHASEANALIGGTAGGNDRMLINAGGTNALCLTCHDGEDQEVAGNAPDVMTAATITTDERKGGAFQAASGVASPNAHDLGVASAAAPGGLQNAPELYTASATTGLTCASCHDPHGTANYENLLTDPNPNNSLVDPISVVLSTDVFLTTNLAGANTPSTKYDMDNVRYANGKISDFCADCHADFHHRQGSDNVAGDANGVDDAWERHPTGRSIADAETAVISVTNMNSANGHVDKANWIALTSNVPTGNPTAAIDGDEYPICLTCHQAHGTAHDAMTLWDDGSTASRNDGATIQDTCNQCHNK